MMCHSLTSYPVVCPLDVYVSFPGMMQDDKGNIKVNLGVASVQQLPGIYCGISVFCLYTDMALYNNRVCKAFNKMVETVKQEEKAKQKEKYPW